MTLQRRRGVTFVQKSWPMSHGVEAGMATVAQPYCKCPVPPVATLSFPAKAEHRPHG